MTGHLQALMAKPPKLRMFNPMQGFQATKALGWAGRHTTSSASRGYGYAWQQARERVLRRDFGLCVPCRAAGLVSKATAVDHIVPKFEGGGDDEANLQAICQACHTVKTAAESKRARGYG